MTEKGHNEGRIISPKNLSEIIIESDVKDIIESYIKGCNNLTDKLKKEEELIKRTEKLGAKPPSELRMFNDEGCRSFNSGKELSFSTASGERISCECRYVPGKILKIIPSASCKVVC